MSQTFMKRCHVSYDSNKTWNQILDISIYFPFVLRKYFKEEEKKKTFSQTGFAIQTFRLFCLFCFPPFILSFLSFWLDTQLLTMEPYTVQAEYSFQGENNDELRFEKGDIITVTQREDGGWWEGTLGEKTGWFPSNYVREYKGIALYLVIFFI